MGNQLLDQNQILQRAFDPTQDRLKVDASLSASIVAPPGIEVKFDAADDNVAIRNSANSNELLINSDGSINTKVSGIVTTSASTPATGTSTSVSSSATNVTVLASNASRKGATVYNESTQVLYLKLGVTSSLTSYTLQIAGGGYYEVPFGYTGQIDGIWASANGSARVSELT